MIKLRGTRLRISTKHTRTYNIILCITMNLLKITENIKVLTRMFNHKFGLIFVGWSKIKYFFTQKICFRFISMKINQFLGKQGWVETLMIILVSSKFLAALHCVPDTWKAPLLSLFLSSSRLSFCNRSLRNMSRHTVGQIPKKCKETSNLMWLLLKQFILFLFVCWKLIFIQ